MHNRASILLGIIIGIVTTSVIASAAACTLIDQPPALNGSRALLHTGTVEQRIDGEIQDQYEAVTSIQLIVENGEIVDATMHLVASHPQEALLMKGGDWQFFNHVPPTPAMTPTVTPTPEPTRVMLEDGSQIKFVNAEPAKFMSHFGEVVPVAIHATGLYTDDTVYLHTVQFVIDTIITVTVTPTPDNRQAHATD